MHKNLFRTNSGWPHHVTRITLISSSLFLLVICFQNCGIGASVGFSSVDEAVVGRGVLKINDGAPFTRLEDVSLSIEPPQRLAKPAQMYVTDQGDCSQGGFWEDYRETKLWTLKTTNSQVAVFAKFRPAAQKELESACVQATIIRDTIGPELSMASAPPSRSADLMGRFTIIATDNLSGVAGLECSFDESQFSSCTEQIRQPLSLGTHSFSVRATDGAGNTSTPLDYEWEILAGLPVAVFDSTPAAISNVASGSFQFSFSDSTGGLLDHFECQLDGSPSFSLCTSPYATGVLSEGTHTLRLRAHSTAGVTSPTVSYTWTIDTTPPVVTLSATAASYLYGSTVTVNYAASDALSGVKRMTGGFDGDTSSVLSAPGSATTTASGTAGLYTVIVEDNAGNSTTRTVNWTVTLPVPELCSSLVSDAGLKSWERANTSSGSDPLTTFTGNSAHSVAAALDVTGKRIFVVSSDNVHSTASGIFDLQTSTWKTLALPTAVSSSSSINYMSAGVSPERFFFSWGSTLYSMRLDDANPTAPTWASTTRLSGSYQPYLIPITGGLLDFSGGQYGTQTTSNAYFTKIPASTGIVDAAGSQTVAFTDFPAFNFSSGGVYSIGNGKYLAVGESKAIYVGGQGGYHLIDTVGRSVSPISKSNHPGERTGMGATVFGERLYAFGGRSEPVDHGSSFGPYEYNWINDQWTLLRSSPTEVPQRYLSGACGISDGVKTFGAFATNNGFVTVLDDGSVVEFNVAANVFRRIGKTINASGFGNILGGAGPQPIFVYNGKLYWIYSLGQVLVMDLVSLGAH